MLYVLLMFSWFQCALYIYEVKESWVIFSSYTEDFNAKEISIQEKEEKKKQNWFDGSTKTHNFVDKIPT